MKLIDNWKESGKLWTIQWSLAVVAMNLLASLLPLVQVHVSVPVYAGLNATAAALTIIFRVLSQTPKPE
ncbi:TPA: hypothetical protein NG650_004192 [Vibrio parahaemolyticus]|jgi:hypothetical protein|uniref:Uncharacterized protein n=1 Tax=Vibrio chagasii TaxID=170679 RepID=A0A7V7NR67_9VIBR|nr:MULTISPECIES: hypothetical protein [Vibrio]KAB0476513.1 hypothetical protein F7Q91_18915 [Vibrio chagasii]MCF9536193.1 hypothetical protein [Vibrio parahaemolyticus]MCF9614195.1 hypothetical protein [Vibrio parahaemolyticus]MCQ6434777.1 hypothetical protein [Vibrio parahaemolyticus]MCQ6443970.1 hypothetical protein [Vibrio parahaemolyticus]